MSKQPEISENIYFGTPIYTVERKDFLPSVSIVSEESLNEVKENTKINEIYPLIMSNNFMNDARIADFCQFIGETSWNILFNQGYNMENMSVSITEMWTQEHYRGSSMDQHTHGHGSQIVGFYFLEVPDDAPKAIFYDPRYGKLPVDLEERDPNKISIASRMINYSPAKGLIIFTNSWLSHSFSRNPSNKPFKFVHFNISAQIIQNCATHEVEII